MHRILVKRRDGDAVLSPRITRLMQTLRRVRHELARNRSAGVCDLRSAWPHRAMITYISADDSGRYSNRQANLLSSAPCLLIVVSISAVWDGAEATAAISVWEEVLESAWASVVPRTNRYRCDLRIREQKDCRVGRRRVAE